MIRHQLGFAKDIIIVILFLGALVYLAARGLGSIVSFDTAAVTSASSTQQANGSVADRSSYPSMLRVFGLFSLVTGIMISILLHLLFSNRKKAVGAAAILGAMAIAVAAANSSSIPEMGSINWMIWTAAVLLLLGGIYELATSSE